MTITILDETKSERAKETLLRREGNPSLLSDWVDVVFIHFSVDRELLQKDIPFELDVYDGKCFVSLVFFTIKKLRPALGGKMTALLCTPVAEHRYFNVRTYVRHGEEKGIYFITEWLSSWLSVFLGSLTYGLPYHLGDLNYQQDDDKIFGKVSVPNLNGQFQYSAILRNEPLRTCEEGTLDEFFLENYIAFAKNKDQHRSFRIWHEPWLQARIDILHMQDHLIPKIGSWGKTLKFIKAHYSPGVFNVWIGKPQRVAQ